jgi:hypothetical protein
MNVLCIEPFCPPNKEQQTLLLSSIILKHGHNFDYWNQPLNMGMRVCYPAVVKLDCAATYCYTWKAYYIRYNRFTSICDMDWPSLVYYDTRANVNVVLIKSFPSECESVYLLIVAGYLYPSFRRQPKAR